MIYLDNDNLIIRSMEKGDGAKLEKCFREQNWDKPLDVLERYYQEQMGNKRYVFIAELNGEIAGYATLLLSAPCGPFAGEGLPEIKDFNVFIKYQRKGIGNMLLDAAEKTAAKINSAVSLGVGLHYGYGTAQRMYVKRGYIPDGSGVWYMDKPLEQYADCNNNDDLVLFLSKKLDL